MPSILALAVTTARLIAASFGSVTLSPLLESYLEPPQRPQIPEDYQADLLQYGDYMSLAVNQLRSEPIGKVPAHIEIVQRFRGNASDCTGYTFIDYRQGICGLVFRGTRKTLKAHWTNLRLTRVEFTEPVVGDAVNLFVHAGYYAAFKDTAEIAIGSLREAAREFPEFRVLVGGHSQGGAVATVTAAAMAPWIREEGGSRFELVAFGSPRVGNREFAHYIGNIGLGRVTRYVHENDPVPHTPPYALGYVHIPGEVYTHNGLHYQCSENLLGYVDDDFNPEDPECSWKRSEEIPRSRKAYKMAHGLYLGKCMPRRDYPECLTQYQNLLYRRNDVFINAVLA